MPINISTSPACFRWKPACWLRVSGDDAASFLQGQFTNDLRALVPGGAAYGLWLTVKGKVLADSFVLRGGAPNEFWVGSYFSPAARIIERLESHVIADDVVVEDQTHEWTGLSLFGADTPTITGKRPNQGFVFRGRRESAGNLEHVFSATAEEPAWVNPGAAPSIDGEEADRRRIIAGIPAVPADVGPADLPNEAGLEAVAISYSKGCYLGQEVMARLKSMGQVRRRLLRVGGTGESVPVLPSPVFVGARQVGELRSAVRDGAGGWIGLAMVSLLHLAGGAKLAFSADGTPAMQLLEAP